MKKAGLKETVEFIKRFLKPHYLTIAGIILFLAVAVFSVSQIIRLGQSGGPSGGNPVGVIFDWKIAQKEKNTEKKLENEAEIPKYENNTNITIRRDRDGGIMPPLFRGQWSYATPPPDIEP